MIKNLLKQFGELVIDLKSSVVTDIFTSARFRITFLYLLMGLIMLGVAGFVIRAQMLAIADSIIQIIQRLIEANGTFDANKASDLIAQTITDKIQAVSFVIGAWFIITLVVSAYVLAGITLVPIRRTMERKKRFVANVSHELRTPLSIMKTNSEVTLASASGLTHAELIEVLKSNLEEIDRMTKITQFLLTFSSFENALSHLSLSKVDLSEITAAIVKLMAGVAKEKNIALSFESNGPIMIEGNATALGEMVTNLIKNAIFYTPEGGSIWVDVSKKVYGYGGVYLSVRDTGTGIASEDLPYVFEPFHQDRSRRGQDNENHLGLGLTIVKEIVVLHHAYISVKSKVKQGTSISVRFRAAA